MSGCNKGQELEQEEIVEVGEETINNGNSEEIDVSDIPLTETALYEEEFSDRMEHDWYDSQGNRVWKGLTKEQLKEVTASERARFEEIMKEIDRYSQPVDETVKLSAAKGDRRIALANLCVEYNEMIPFSPEGRYYGEGFDKCPDGYDNRYWIESTGIGYGLDSSGYLIWLFRNVFGETPIGMEDLYQLSQTKQRLTMEELQVGDICMTSDQEMDTHYGVIAGFVDGVPVVSHCDNVYSVKFPMGSTRFSYISSVKNEYLGTSAPVDFTIFFRLVDEWEDEEP